MEELELIARQQPGLVSAENLDEVKKRLEELLARYDNLVYTEDNRKTAQEDKRELDRLYKQIKDQCAKVKKAYMEPFQAFEKQVNQLLQMVDRPRNTVKDFLKEMDSRERENKKGKIQAYYAAHSAPLGDAAEMIWNSATFFNPRWLNKTMSSREWQADVEQKIQDAASFLQETRNLETAQIPSTPKPAAGIPFPPAAAPGSRTIRITGTGRQLAQAQALLESVGIAAEVLEENLDWGFPERLQPDFTAFTAISVKTNGPDAAGDAEIVELSAVRVKDGVLQEKRKSPVQPGRKMHPQAARESGIRDDMLQGQPAIDQVIGRFLEFIGEDTLVGYNIAGRDLYYIGAAAARVGQAMDNPFFDIARYCRRSGKTVSGGLDGLAESLHLLRGGHRALDDAKLAAQIYLHLQNPEGR